MIIDLYPVPAHGAVFAAIVMPRSALKVHWCPSHAVIHALIRAKKRRFCRKSPVHQCRFAVVNMGYNGDIPKFCFQPLLCYR